jgi:hypothetical protein
VVEEILNFTIKREASRGTIRGIDLAGVPEAQLIAQYADDTSLSIRGAECYVQATADLLRHFSIASGLVINEAKSSAYLWLPHSANRPHWTRQFGWQWAEAGDVSKLLGAPFGLTLSTQDVDSFLVDKIEAKLKYWATTKLNFAGREVIVNGVLISSLLYFLGIWGGTKAGISRVTSKIRNYYWCGGLHRTRARTA